LAFGSRASGLGNFDQTLPDANCAIQPLDDKFSEAVRPDQIARAAPAVALVRIAPTVARTPEPQTAFEGRVRSIRDGGGAVQ